MTKRWWASVSAAFILLFALAAQASAQLPPIIPREVLFGNPERATPRLSPDGRMLAYLAPDNGVLNVWVRTVGRTDDRVVTSDRRRGIRNFFWQPDSQHVIYAQDEGGNENFHVYQTNIQTKSTRDLTPFENVQARIVAVDPNFPDQMLVALNRRDPRRHDVYRVNLRTGEAELDTENPGGVEDWTADNRMQVRAAQVLMPDGSTEIRIRNDARSPWRTLLSWGADEGFGGVYGFTPDNNKLWVATSLDANAERLVEVDIASGRRRVIAQDPQYDVTGAMINPRTRILEAVLFTRARREWQVIDNSVRADFAALRRVRDGDFQITGRDLQDRTWLVAYTMDNGPVYYYTYDRRTRRATPLFSNRPALERYQLARMQPISYRSRDGLTIHGYLTLPVGAQPRNLPAILLVHGGPWGRDVWGFDPTAQWLANRGYVVLQINFRGSTGYGKEFLNAGNREWAGRMHDDLIDGKRWLVEQGYADARRVGIMGGSYGGYATLVGLAFTPDEFAAGVDIVGPSNIVTLLQSIPPYWDSLRAMFRRRVGNEETEQEFLRSRSPLFRADQIRAPLLIAQGANDPRVKQAESEQIVEAMRRANRPVEYILYTDEGHGFARPANRLHFYAKAEEFLARHMGGRAEPMGEIAGHSGVVK